MYPPDKVGKSDRHGSSATDFAVSSRTVLRGDKFNGIIDVGISQGTFGTSLG
jgi:hypothetical protein